MAGFFVCVFFKQITLEKQSTGKADICWAGPVTTAEWLMSNMQGADVSEVLQQLLALLEQCREHLKRHEG